MQITVVPDGNFFKLLNMAVSDPIENRNLLQFLMGEKTQVVHLAVPDGRENTSCRVGSSRWNRKHKM